MKKFWHKKENIKLLQTVAAESNSIGDLLLRLGLRQAGGNYKNIQYHIAANNIDVSHFDKLKGVKAAAKLRRYESYEVFCINSQVSRNYLKKTILTSNIIPYICGECHQTSIWNGKSLILQIDHINGIYNDNRLENLRWICPNCHSQTQTFAGRNQGKKA